MSFLDVGRKITRGSILIFITVSLFLNTVSCKDDPLVAPNAPTSSGGSYGRMIQVSPADTLAGLGNNHVTFDHYANPEVY